MESGMQSHKIVSRDEWTQARKALLAKEKELTRARDLLSAERRTLPWVKVEETYVFDTDAGKKTLPELFGACETQREVDYFWDRLTSEGGQEGPCGWLKDKFGLSWQVVPTALIQMLLDRDAKKVERVTNAFLQMKKFDLAALERAYQG
jgi:hypothetical protein